MAPPHRRSCLNCVKSKRKCDLATPRCQRCASRNFDCNYAGVEDETRSSEHSETTSGESSWSGATYHEVMDLPSQPEVNLNTGSSVLDQNDWTLDDPLATMQMNLDGGIELPLTEEDSPSWANLTVTNIIDEFIDTDRIVFEPEDDYVISGDIHMERVRFGIDHLKRYPKMFCHHAQTPFIHKKLYSERTPVVIQDALSACALYATKNRQNEALVFGDISKKANELVNRTTPFHSPMDLLASTQALILYQIIRLLDGDIRQRADAESCEPILISWSEQLVGKIRPLRSPNLAGNCSTADACISTLSWQHWVLEESVRRTALTSYMLQGLYSFFKVGYDTVSGKINKLCFTAQDALWNAPSEFYWRKALDENNHFEIILSNWDVATKGAFPHDFDDLGVLMFAIYKGIDDVAKWLGEENLPKYGLDKQSLMLQFGRSTKSRTTCDLQHLHETHLLKDESHNSNTNTTKLWTNRRTEPDSHGVSNSDAMKLQHGRREEQAPSNITKESLRSRKSPELQYRVGEKEPRAKAQSMKPEPKDEMLFKFKPESTPGEGWDLDQLTIYDIDDFESKITHNQYLLQRPVLPLKPDCLHWLAPATAGDREAAVFPEMITHGKRLHMFYEHESLYLSLHPELDAPNLSIMNSAGNANTKFTIPYPREASRAALTVALASTNTVDE
ncbi:hypothetical protein B7463_g9213, partial [Scytalidium lignicola]